MIVFASARALSISDDPAEVLRLYAMAKVKAVLLAAPVGPEALEALEQASFLSWWQDEPQDDLARNLACGDEDLRRRMVREVAALIERAGAAGALGFSLAAGFALEETRAPGRPTRSIPRARARHQLLRSLDALATAAERAHVPLWLVNADGTDPAALGSEAAELDEVFATLQIPYLGLVLDWDALEQVTGERPERRAEWLARAKPWVRALRVRLRDQGPPAGFVAALAAHPAWHQLPWGLEARGESLGSVLEACDALAQLRRPVAGPAG